MTQGETKKDIILEKIELLKESLINPHESVSPKDQDTLLHLITKLQKDIDSGRFAEDVTFNDKEKYENKNNATNCEENNSSETTNSRLKIFSIFWQIVILGISAIELVVGAACILQKKSWISGACIIFSSIFFSDLRQLFCNPRKSVQSIIVAAILFSIGIFAL